MITVGSVFGRLRVLARAENKDGGYSRWKCACICGTEIICRGGSLTTGNTMSCGCLSSELNLKNEIGNIYGKLVVISREENSRKMDARWLCLCECGNKKIILGRSLREGRTRSCGCLRIEVIKTVNVIHGNSRIGMVSKSYISWQGMKDRCLNKNNTHFNRYGGRGIEVCERWLNSFENFLEDMGAAVDGMEIDRIDNNKGYFLENCRWASRKEQCRNTSKSKRWVINGETYLSLPDAVEKTGIKQTKIFNICSGYTSGKYSYPPKEGCYSYSIYD